MKHTYILIAFLTLVSCKKEINPVYREKQYVQFKEEPGYGIVNYLQVRIVYPAPPGDTDVEYMLCSVNGVATTGWGDELKPYTGSYPFTWGDKPADKLPNKNK